MALMLMGSAAKMLKSSENKKEVTKKIKASKFISGKNVSEKKGSAIVKSESSSIVAKPSATLAPRISIPTVKETRVPKGKVSFDFLNDILDSLVKNTSSLLKISKSEYKSEVKGAEAERRSDQLERKRDREEKVESDSRVRNRGKSFKIAAPKLPLFDSALEFLKRFAIGTAAMQVLSILSDPKKKDSIIGFLTSNMEVILLGMVGIMGALILAPLTPILGAFGILFNITAALVGSLLSLLLNPIVLPVIGTAIAAGAIIALTPTPAGQNSQITGPNAVWRDPRLKPRSRKAIIESAFEHMPYNTWPQDAKDLYEKDLRSLGISLKDAQDQLRKKVSQHTQQRNQIQQSSSSTFSFPDIFGFSSSTSQPQTTAVSQPTSLSTGMGTMTGLLTGHGGGTPFHVDTRWARDLPMDIVVPMIDSMAAVLAAEGRVMEMGSAGSVSGKRYPVNGTFDEKKRFLENATAGHHTQRSMAAFDYFIPKAGETRFGKSAEYANIPAPALPPGYKISFHSGTSQSGGAFYQITDQNGKVVFKTFHGDPSRSTLSLIGQKNVLTSTPSSIAQYAPYEQPAGTPALVPVPIPPPQPQPARAAGGTQVISSQPSVHQVLNTYYNFQVLGFLYKQG